MQAFSCEGDNHSNVDIENRFETNKNCSLGQWFPFELKISQWTDDTDYLGLHCRERWNAEYRGLVESLSSSCPRIEELIGRSTIDSALSGQDKINSLVISISQNKANQATRVNSRLKRNKVVWLIRICRKYIEQTSQMKRL